MARVLVNDVEIDMAAGARTWGETLRVLDRDAGARGEVVTAVRFDGVNEPALRHPVLLPALMADFESVEVETARPGDLVHLALDRAVIAAVSFTDAANRLGAAFRGADISAASRDLADLAVGLGSLVSVTSAVATATATDLSKVRDDDGSATDLIGDLAARTDALIGAQRAGDWMTVADVLEYDLPPTLRRWPAVLTSLRSSIPAPTLAAA